MSEFRNGQWVLFACDMPEAHKARDGRVVGIYRRAGKDPLTGAAVPPHVAPVRADGRNVRRLDEASGEAITVTLDPARLERLEPLTDRADMPPGREVDPHWTPEP